jgi:formylglycine-generating enzyme required for sulfatase activity
MKKTALLLLFCASLLHAQTQADLERQVQAEQWADAAKTVTTLLQASPADATLKSYQAEISKHLAPAMTNQVVAASVPAPMTVDDKIALRTVERVARDASATKDAEEQKKLCRELLAQSAGLAQRYPDQLKVWLFRAQAALVLDDATTGGEAGQQIKRLMTDQSGDAVLDVLAELNRKGWLDTAKMAKQKAASEKFAALKGRDMKLPLGNDVELELVWVPAGYWVGKYEVTQAEYTAVIGSNPAKYRGERRPVENVSWNDAMEFSKKVTEHARSAGWLPVDWKMTLPTEKQWEYFVGDATLQQAVYDRYTASGDKLGTSPVGSLAGNRYGLYDVRGNVWEWCADWYDSEQKGRVLRGGSWNRDGEYMAVSYRSYGAPGSRDDYGVGFRVVLVSGSDGQVGLP